MYVVITANEIVFQSANYDLARDMARSLSDTTKDTVKLINLPTTTVVAIYLQGSRAY